MKDTSPQPNLNGKLRGTFQELHTAGCIQTRADNLKELSEAYEAHGETFNAVMAASAQNACNGCPALLDHRGVICPAYKKYHTGWTETQPRIAPLSSTHQSETVKAEASRRNVSLGEVRRQRALKR